MAINTLRNDDNLQHIISAGNHTLIVDAPVEDVSYYSKRKTLTRPTHMHDIAA